MIDRAGSDIYGRMARLGLARVQAQQGKYDAAIATYKEMAATAKDLPVDGILMQLAHTYAAAGKKVEASQTYKRVTDEFPTSAYAADARKEIETLKSWQLARSSNCQLSNCQPPNFQHSQSVRTRLSMCRAPNSESVSKPDVGLPRIGVAAGAVVSPRDACSQRQRKNESGDHVAPDFCAPRHFHI